MANSNVWASPEPEDMPEGYTPAPYEAAESSRAPSSRIPGMHHQYRPQRLPQSSSGAVPKAWRVRNTTNTTETDGNITIKTKTTTVQRDPGGTSTIEETVETLDRNPRRRARQEQPPAGPTPVRRLVATPGADVAPRRPKRQLQAPEISRDRPLDPAKLRQREPEITISKYKVQNLRGVAMGGPDVSMPVEPMTMPMEDPRAPMQRVQDPGMSRERMQDPRMTRQRAQDPGMSRERMQDPRMPRQRGQDPGMSRERLKDPRMPRQRAQDPGMSRERMQDPRMPRQRAQDPGMSRERMQDPRMPRQRATRPESAPGMVKKKSVETIQEPGRTVKIVKTSESVRPGSSRQPAAPRPIPSARVARPPQPPPASSRSTKVVKSTTSIESGGTDRPAYKKRTKIVESTTSMESAASSRSRPTSSKSAISTESVSSSKARGGNIRMTAAASQQPPRGTRMEPPGKFVSRKKGDDRKKRESDARELERDVKKQLVSMAAKAPRKSLKATGAKSGLVAPPTMKTPYGPVEAEKKIVSKKSVIRYPGKPEIIARGLTGIKTIGPGRAEITEIEVQRLSPKAKTPESVVEKEVIEVTSSVAMGGGFIETSRTVSYDAPEPPPKKPQLSPQQVAQLVAEENADIENTKDLLMPELQASRPVTYPVKKNVELELLHQESVSILEQSIIPMVPTADDEQEDPQPEMIATIMSTEERGLTMASPPSNVYDYLFSDEKSEVFMDVSSVAPAPLQDIVIPLTMVDQSQETAKSPAVLQASMNLQIRTEEPVPEDMYVETVGKEMPKSKNTARKGTTKKTRKGPLLTAQIPPWGIQDVEPVIDLVGASPAGTFVAVPEEEADEVVQIDPTVDGIEYLLEMEPPSHTSRVQLRGSQNPSWFPGYYLALPKIPDVLTVVKSPSVVFASAWKATQPDIFAEESLIVA